MDRSLPIIKTKGIGQQTFNFQNSEKENLIFRPNGAENPLIGVDRLYNNLYLLQEDEVACAQSDYVKKWKDALPKEATAKD